MPDYGGGGKHGMGSDTSGRGRPGGDRRGVGGMTPGPGPGGQFIGGATPDPSGVAQGGTTEGFANQPGGGGGDGPGQTLQDLFAAQAPPVMSTAPVAAAPEYAEIENPSEEESLYDRILAKVNQYYTQPAYGLNFAQAIGGLPKFGAFSFLGNLANFNPQFDEEGNLTDTSAFGDIGTATFGAYDFTNPEYDMTPDQMQYAFNELYSQDLDSTKGYSVNELAAKKYADSIAPGVFDSLDLSKTTEQMKQDRIDAREMGGGDGPQGITLAGTQAPFDDTGGGTDTDSDTDPGAGADDPLSIYNSFTETEKRTVDQIMDLGYDMSYAVNYIVGGGPVFSYGGGAYSGNF